MAKNKTSKIPQYEVLYIVSNKYTEEEAQKINKETKKLLESKGAKVSNIEEWGKKKLAYSINHFNHGYYYLIEFETEGINLAGINKELRMKTELLRYIVAVRSDKAKAEEEKIKKALEEEKKQKIKETEDKEEEKKQEPKKETKKEKKKISLEDLDDKLDKILDTKDLI